MGSLNSLAKILPSPSGSKDCFSLILFYKGLYWVYMASFWELGELQGWLLSPCQTELVSDGFKTDLLLAKTEPINQADGASVKTY